MDISILDKEKVFQKLLLAPLLSHQTDTKDVRSVFRGYIADDDSGDDNEGQFVKDLFTLSTQEVIDKWYGGSEEATDILFHYKNPEI